MAVGNILLTHSIIEDAYKFMCDNSADTYKNLLTYFHLTAKVGVFIQKIFPPTTPLKVGLIQST